MAMKKAMTMTEVNAILANVRKGVKQFGGQYAPSFSTSTLAEALVTLAANSNLDGPTQEEHTKLARQLAACSSREKGLRKKIAGVTNEDDAAELKADEDL